MSLIGVILGFLPLPSYPRLFPPSQRSPAGDLATLRAALETDTDRARRLLAKMLGKVTLRRDGARLLTDIKENLTGLFDVDVEVFGRAGAGSPFLTEFAPRIWRVRVAP